MPDEAVPPLVMPNTRVGILFRVVALAIIGVNIGRSDAQGFGASGVHLVITLSYALAAAAWMLGQVPDGWATWWPGRGQGSEAVRLGIVGVAGGVLCSLAPATSGCVLAFVAVIGAARQLRLRDAIAIGAVTLVALGVASPFGDHGASVLIGYPLGLLAAFLGGYNFRQYRVRADQAIRLAHETERATGEEARAVRLDERSRIAREIHDVLAHSMSALSIQLEAARLLAERTTGEDRARLLEHLDRARALTRDGLSETRQALGTLRGDPLPLAPLLEELAAGYRSDTGSDASVELSGDPGGLRPDVTLAVFRVAQEALTNARRYADGTSVSVGLSCGHNETVLRIADHVDLRVDPRPDGTPEVARVRSGQLGRAGTAGPGTMVADAAPAGPADDRAPGPPAPVGGGYGLVGMRERAALLGGSLSAGPAGAGWAVELRLPA